MEKKILYVLLSIILIMSSIFFISGCDSSSVNYDRLLSKISAENLMSDIQAKEVDTIDLAKHNAAVTDFAIRLFQNSLDSQKNTLISPLSVLSALSMTANGASGETLSQMEETFRLSAETLNQYLYTYAAQLPQDENNELLLANSIWFKDTGHFTVNEEFLQTNASYYGADIYKAPFDQNTLKDINDWTKGKTKGRIPEILDRIPENAVMYLVNAMTFDAKWETIYEGIQIYEKNFTNLDGTQSIVKMMYSEESCYLKDEEASGFIKYYKDGKYAFVALLPRIETDIFEYISTLNGEHLQNLISNKKNMTIHASIPKFESEYSTEMSTILKNMGIQAAFNDGLANFENLGTSSKGNLHISRVIHKTFISVAEEGTEAAAAALVEEADTSAEVENYVTIHLNRPFVYMLIDCENNVPFFIGTVLELES